MSGKGRGKAKIQMSKPELPKFLQKIKEQIVINEETERKEQAAKKRKDRVPKPDDPEDDPTIVKIDDDDLTVEEYKRLKRDTITVESPDLSKLVEKSSPRTTSKVANKNISYGSSSEDED